MCLVTIPSKKVVAMKRTIYRIRAFAAAIPAPIIPA